MVALAVRTGIPFRVWAAEPSEVIATALDLLRED